MDTFDATNQWAMPKGGQLAMSQVMVQDRFA
jgi:hypothetical protein